VLPRGTSALSPSPHLTRVTSSAIIHARRGVAQSGSALEWGSSGRRFKSVRPDLRDLSAGNALGSFCCRATSPPARLMAEAQGKAGTSLERWRCARSGTYLRPGCFCQSPYISAPQAGQAGFSAKGPAPRAPQKPWFGSARAVLGPTGVVIRANQGVCGVWGAALPNGVRQGARKALRTADRRVRSGPLPGKPVCPARQAKV
jgi:hypothetical protein